MSGGRRRKLGWVWAGVAAVAASAVAFTLTGQELGARTEVLVLARDVPAGHVLQPSDLRGVQVATDTGVVPVADRGEVVGRRAKVPLVAGSLLARGQIGRTASFPPPGRSQVALAVEAGGAPPELERGDRVAVLAGPSGAGVAEKPDTATDSVVTGTVTGVRAPEAAGGPRVVTVLVETAAARRAAGLAHPRVVVLPAEGREAP